MSEFTPPPKKSCHKRGKLPIEASCHLYPHVAIGAAAVFGSSTLASFFSPGGCQLGGTSEGGSAEDCMGGC